MRLYDYAASGNCFKVRLLLGLLGRPYERVPVDIFAGDTLTDEFARDQPAARDAGARARRRASGSPSPPRSSGTSPRARRSCRTTRWSARRSSRGCRSSRSASWAASAARASGCSRAATAGIEARLATGRGALRCSTRTSTAATWVVGDAPTIADLGLFPYVSVAGDAGVDLRRPHVCAWLDRIRALPGFVDDFVTYPPNARPGRDSRSISVPPRTSYSCAWTQCQPW